MGIFRKPWKMNIKYQSAHVFQCKLKFLPSSGEEEKKLVQVWVFVKILVFFLQGLLSEKKKTSLISHAITILLCHMASNIMFSTWLTFVWRSRLKYDLTRGSCIHLAATLFCQFRDAPDSWKKLTCFFLSVPSWLEAGKWMFPSFSEQDIGFISLLFRCSSELLYYHPLYCCSKYLSYIFVLAINYAKSICFSLKKLYSPQNCWDLYYMPSASCGLLASCFNLQSSISLEVCLCRNLPWPLLMTVSQQGPPLPSTTISTKSDFKKKHLNSFIFFNDFMRK